jgi:hypothetical protein
MNCEHCQNRKWVLGFGGIRKPCECVAKKDVKKAGRPAKKE